MFLEEHRRGRDEGTVSKGSDRDANEVFKSFQCVVQGGAAVGTEREGDSATRVAGPNELGALTLDVDTPSFKAGLYPERTARPALAGATVANRNPHRRVSDGGTKLSAAAGCNQMRHGGHSLIEGASENGI